MGILYQKPLPPTHIHSDEPERIFVFWWQGTDGLPDIVRICINSIKQNSNGREVVMITKDNIRKLQSKIISIYRQFMEIQISNLRKHMRLLLVKK